MKIKSSAVTFLIAMNFWILSQVHKSESVASFCKVMAVLFALFCVAEMILAVTAWFLRRKFNNLNKELRKRIQENAIKEFEEFTNDDISEVEKRINPDGFFRKKSVEEINEIVKKRNEDSKKEDDNGKTSIDS